jgi:hypothetical protein
VAPIVIAAPPVTRGGFEQTAAAAGDAQIALSVGCDAARQAVEVAVTNVPPTAAKLPVARNSALATDAWDSLMS